MYTPPNRQLFTRVLLGILGVVYLLGIWFIVDEANTGDKEEVAGFSSFIAVAALLCQWLMVGGKAGELERPEKGIRIGQVVAGSLVMGWFSFMWTYYLLLTIPVIPIGFDTSWVFVLAGLIGAGTAAYLLWRLQGVLPRYKLVFVLFWMILGGALGLGGLGGLTSVETDLLRPVFSEAGDKYTDYRRREAYEVFTGLSIATAVGTALWAIAPAAYLIGYARAYKEAKKVEEMHDSERK